MADPVIPVAVPAPVAAAVPAAQPVVENVSRETAVPVAAPVAAAEAAPVVADQGTPAPAKVEAAPAAEAPKDVTAGSLLSDAAKPAAEPVKPDAAAAAVVDPNKPAEVVLPTYEALKTPEGVAFDPAQVTKFDALVGKFETATKADHDAVVAFRQELADYYVAEQTAAGERFATATRDAWTRTRDTWKQTFVDDTDMGGNRQQTTLARCGEVIDRFAGTAEQAADLKLMFRMTGAGDHPALIRLLNNMGKVLIEAKPVPATVPKNPVKPSRGARRYAASSNQA